MGQKLTQSKIVPNVEKYLARNHQNFQFIQLVGNGLMTKTAVVEDTKDHYPMLLKIFFKLSKDDKDKYKQEIKKVDNIFQLFQTTKLHNIAPILHIIDNDNLCIVVREFFQHNLKERIFCMIAYTPKATVQAAIGSIPLSMGLDCGNLVLSVAVLAILITAPFGAIGIDKTYKVLLCKGEESLVNESC